MPILRFAWGNVRRARRDYLVYLLTLALGVAVFYAFNAIALTLQTDPVTHEQAAAPIRLITQGLTIFLALVMGFLMVYANGYIMRRRKREFGLYQVLGMSRRRLAAIIAIETLILCSCALVLGALAGVALSQLLVFLVAAMFDVSASGYRFVWSPGALLLTTLCLAGIFIVTLLCDIRSASRSAPADLMAAGRRCEGAGTGGVRVPAALFSLGVVLCGLAYARLLHDGYPLFGAGGTAAHLGSAVHSPADPWGAFSVTTMLAAAGTILLFFGLSGTLLGALRRARRLYWRGLIPFTSRQIAARVNTVSLSMAVISMILFLTITCVVTGTSFADATRTVLHWSTPADYSCEVNYLSPGPRAPLDLIAASPDLGSIARAHAQIDLYRSRPDGASAPLITMRDLIGDAESSGGRANGMEIDVIKASAYDRYRVFLGKDPIEFGADAYMLVAGIQIDRIADIDAALSSGRVMRIGKARLHPAAAHGDPSASTFRNSAGESSDIAIVLPDEIVDAAALPLVSSSLLIDYRADRDAGRLDALLDGIDLENRPAISDGAAIGYWQRGVTRSSVLRQTRVETGAISFISVYIGFVLVIACASILSIQQLTGVADSARSYRTLTELGTGRAAIVRSMAQQLAVLFLAPLAVGLAHALVALSALRDLIAERTAMPIGGTAPAALAVFVTCYGGYLLITFLLGRGIVREAVRTRRKR